MIDQEKNQEVDQVMAKRGLGGLYSCERIRRDNVPIYEDIYTLKYWLVACVLLITNTTLAAQ